MGEGEFSIGVQTPRAVSGSTGHLLSDLWFTSGSRGQGNQDRFWSVHQTHSLYLNMASGYIGNWVFRARSIFMQLKTDPKPASENSMFPL